MSEKLAGAISLHVKPVMKLSHTPIRAPRGSHPEEQIYSRRWAELMIKPLEYPESRKPLNRILMSYPATVDQRVASVAASFICWFGTNVGLGFLELGHSIRDNTPCKHDAYVAAFCVTNRRRFATNSSARLIDLLLQTKEQQDSGVFPVVSTNDIEVIEQISSWLGSEDGQDFLVGCEAEIKRHKDMETIAHHCANGMGDFQYVKGLKALFVIKECQHP